MTSGWPQLHILCNLTRSYARTHRCMHSRTYTHARTHALTYVHIHEYIHARTSTTDELKLTNSESFSYSAYLTFCIVYLSITDSLCLCLSLCLCPFLCLCPSPLSFTLQARNTPIDCAGRRMGGVGDDGDEAIRADVGERMRHPTSQTEEEGKRMGR